MSNINYYINGAVNNIYAFKDWAINEISASPVVAIALAIFSSILTAVVVYKIRNITPANKNDTQASKINDTAIPSFKEENSNTISKTENQDLKEEEEEVSAIENVIPDIKSIDSNNKINYLNKFVVVGLTVATSTIIYKILHGVDNSCSPQAALLLSLISGSLIKTISGANAPTCITSATAICALTYAASIYTGGCPSMRAGHISFTAAGIMISGIPLVWHEYKTQLSGQ